MLWGNFITSGRNIHMDIRMDWLDFSQRSWSLWPKKCLYLLCWRDVTQISNRIKWWSDDILYPKGQFHSDIIMFCRKTFQAIIHQDSATKEEIMTIFHIWLNTQLVTLILDGHPETAANRYLLCCQFHYAWRIQVFWITSLLEFSENTLYCPSTWTHSSKFTAV